MNNVDHIEKVYHFDFDRIPDASNPLVTTVLGVITIGYYKQGRLHVFNRAEGIEECATGSEEGERKLIGIFQDIIAELKIIPSEELRFYQNDKRFLLLHPPYHFLFATDLGSIKNALFCPIEYLRVPSILDAQKISL